MSWVVMGRTGRGHPAGTRVPPFRQKSSLTVHEPRFHQAQGLGGPIKGSGEAPLPRGTQHWGFLDWGVVTDNSH